MQKDKEVKTVGLGFVDALTLLFIALKLTGQIDWNWIWVEESSCLASEQMSHRH